MLIAVATTVVGWGVLCVEEHWRWKGAWDRYRTAALARGVPLEIDSLPKTEVPDEENFAAAPIIKDLFTEYENGIKPPPWFATLRPNGFHRKGGQVRLNDLTKWRDYFVAEGIISKPSEEPAADVLRALQFVEPEFAALREAGARPKSKLPMRAELGVEAPHPYATPFLTAARVYSLRISAHLEFRDSASACQTAREMMRLNWALQDEPLLITALIRIAIITLLDTTIRDGVADDQWAETELQALASDYSTFDWLRDCQDALVAERIYMNKTSELIHDLSSAEIAKRFPTLNPFGNESPDPTATHLCLLAYPRGWFYLGQLKLNEYYDRQISRLESIRQGAPPYFKDSSEDELLQLSRRSPLQRLPYMSAASSAPIVQGVIDKYVQLIARTRTTQTAIHLSRYHHKIGAFPEKLELLVPDFIPDLPRDPIDLAPLRYRRTASGYDLWSIGSDLRDDGGKAIPGKPRDSHADWIFSVARD